MKVYVAAKFEEAQRARALMDRIWALGHQITHDWTSEVVPMGADAAEKLRDFAAGAYDGARAADVLILLGHPNCRGALVEFGLALGGGAACIVVGRSLCENIFFHLSERGAVTHVETEGQALEQLENIAASRAKR